MRLFIIIASGLLIAGCKGRSGESTALAEENLPSEAQSGFQNASADVQLPEEKIGLAKCGSDKYPSYEFYLMDTDPEGTERIKVNSHSISVSFLAFAKEFDTTIQDSLVTKFIEKRQSWMKTAPVIKKRTQKEVFFESRGDRIFLRQGEQDYFLRFVQFNDIERYCKLIPYSTITAESILPLYQDYKIPYLLDFK